MSDEILSAIRLAGAEEAALDGDPLRTSHEEQADQLQIVNALSQNLRQ